MNVRPAPNGGSSPGRRGTALHERLVLAVAALFVCAHLAWLPYHLEDIDSLNFALGLREYDVAKHQPHPPGYPVFTVLARAASPLVSPLASDLVTRDALAMALLAGFAGAVALLLVHRILRATDPMAAGTDADIPLLATALTAATPLFWVTASRPLSDMPGLAAALACQWLLLRAGREAAPRRDALLAALACGVATGIRSQVTWLVVPLLAWLLLRVWRRQGPRVTLAVATASLLGVLTWAVPMVALTGGPGAYRAALTSQASEDFEGVPMLVLQPGLRRLAVALSDTLVAPWGWWPLAVVMLALAAAGVLGLRGRGRLVTWLALGFGPYTGYHLLLQETETTRYALPLAPLVATLVVVGLTRWVPRRARLLAVVCCGIALSVSLQAHRQYVRAGATISEALGRMDVSARAATTRPQVLMHRRVWAETRRARAVVTPAPAFDVLPARRALEWQGATGAWQRGDPVWWLVDPRRGDRSAVDPRGLRWREHVGWPAPVTALLGGMRPHAFDWYDVTAPQWVLLDGWGLTPELAGLSAAADQGPSHAGATALVRGQAGASTLMIGGRYLPRAADTSSPALSVRLADRDLPSVVLPRGWFAFTWIVPAGTTPSAGYSPLQVRALPARDDAEEPVFLEQFDLQPWGVPILALEAGWYEPERDAGTGRQWRWVADQSGLRIAGASGDVTLAIEGTYPRHYDREPVLEMFARGRRIASHVLPRPFVVQQRVTTQDLGQDGRLTWRVSPSFVAGERTGTADARRLALEISSVRVDAVR